MGLPKKGFPPIRRALPPPCSRHCNEELQLRTSLRLRLEQGWKSWIPVSDDRRETWRESRRWITNASPPVSTKADGQRAAPRRTCSSWGRWESVTQPRPPPCPPVFSASP